MELLMSFSIQRETSDGTLSTLDLTIEYIDQADVKAFVNDIEIELTGGVTPYTWEWITPAQIKITPNVPNGLVAMVKRSTPMDAMYHVYDAGAVFKDETVDENFKQVLFLSQEAKEGSGVSDIYSNVNMHGYVIGNHGAAVQDGDLVTFGQYRNDSLGSGFNRVAAEAARDVAVAAKDTAVASATAASGSASAASTSATNAANSASDSDAARVLAQDAASTAVAAYDSFDDRYLGPKNSNPTLDNDGNALLEGALYWNTVVKEMRVYDGTTWAAAYLPADGYLEKSQNLADLIDTTTARSNIGLGNVSNTSDADKPISIAQAAGLVEKDSQTGSASIPAGTTIQRPSSPIVGMLRYNTTLAEMERYQNGTWLPFNTADKAFNEAPLVTVSAGTTTDISNVLSNSIYISGAASITALGVAPAGARRNCVFQGICSLVHNATSLVLPGATSITTAVGDAAEFVSLGAGNWQCLAYTKADGSAVQSLFSKEYTSPDQTITSGGSLTLTHNLTKRPKLVTISLICKTAELGYSVGQEAFLFGQWYAAGGNAAGVVVVHDSTNVFVRFGNATPPFWLPNWATGVPGNITNSNWGLIVRAWA